MQDWRSRDEKVTAQDWWEEVEGKSSLQWYRSAKEGFQVERYIDSALGRKWSDVGFSCG